MSTCISRHGEYSSHELDDAYTCKLCGVLDEEALTAELVDLRAAYERVVAERDEARAEVSARDDWATDLAAALDVPGDLDPYFGIDRLVREDSRHLAEAGRHARITDEQLRLAGEENRRLRSDLNQATAVVEAAEAWRDQFAEPDAVKWPRRSGLIAAVDAYRAYRAAPTGGVEG